jgi:hypothetical protein
LHYFTHHRPITGHKLFKFRWYKKKIHLFEQQTLANSLTERNLRQIPGLEQQNHTCKYPPDPYGISEI